MTTQPHHSTPASAEQLQHDWDNNPRWAGVERSFTAEDVVRLRGRIQEEHTLARRGAEKLWTQLKDENARGEFTNALGALTGNQAVQQVKAGLKAIYLSGWQVAGDANLVGQTYPDQSLYPANSVPQVVRRINNALKRADQIEHAEDVHTVENWMAPIVADAEAGFGGPLNAFELMKSMIDAGAAGDPCRIQVPPVHGHGRDGVVEEVHSQVGALGEDVHAELGGHGEGARVLVADASTPEKIPAGVRSGVRIRLSGQGEAGVAGGPSGDLYVETKVTQDPTFTRDGDDLHCTVPISITTAALGGSIQIPTLGGKAEIEIPEGTQHGKTFRLRGKGIKGVRSSYPGDLYCHIVVETPVKLTEHQRKLLKELDESLKKGGEKHSPNSKSWTDRVKNLFK